MAIFLVTGWQINTSDGHLVDILHRNVPTDDVRADADERRVSKARLSADGRLFCTVDGVEREVDRADAHVQVYTRPHAEHGVPIDSRDPDGAAKILAALDDPAYNALPEEFATVGLSFAALAALPGAIGRLGSLSYGYATPEEFAKDALPIPA